MLTCMVVIGLASGCKDPAAARPGPKAAAVSFARAFQNGDVAAAQAASVGDDASAQVLAVMLDSENARRRLTAAAEARFGQGADVFPVRTRPSVDLLQAAERGREQVDGDAATVKDPITGLALRLRKVGTDWKVDRAALTGFAQSDLGRVLPDARAFAAVYREVAAQVQAGTFASAQDVQSALRARLAARGSGPATRRSVGETMHPTATSSHPAG